MNGKKNAGGKRGEEDMFSVFAEAQCGNVESILTESLLSKTAVHVFAKFVVDYTCKDGFRASVVTLPLQLLMFSTHPSVRRQAAATDIGTNFNRMKMRLVQNYISNSVHSANIKEQRQSAGGANATTTELNENT